MLLFTVRTNHALVQVVKGQQLTLEVFDHDDPGEDEFLGRATVQTSVVAARGKVKNILDKVKRLFCFMFLFPRLKNFQIESMWVELEDVKSGRAQMSLEWMEVSNDSGRITSSNTASERDLAKCLLHVYVDSAKEVYAGGGDKPSPMAKLRVGQASPHSTYLEDC